MNKKSALYRKVISAKNLPNDLPIWQAAVTWLLLDRFHADGWIYGVVATLFAVAFIAVVTSWFTNEFVDIFEDKP